MTSLHASPLAEHAIASDLKTLQAPSPLGLLVGPTWAAIQAGSLLWRGLHAVEMPVDPAGLPVMWTQCA